MACAGLVRGGALVGLQQLARLDLSYNTIHTVEGGGLAGLSKLQHLDLRHNRITKLNSDVFEGIVYLPGFSSRCAGTEFNICMGLKYVTLCRECFLS